MFMIACDVVIGIVVLIGKVHQHTPKLEYAILLANYQFGLIRRGLAGQFWTFLTPGRLVSPGDAYLLGGVLVVLTIVAFLLVFGSIFRYSTENLPLLAMTFGSPFWFKNFIVTTGYFDLLGCLVALIALVLPLQAFYLPVVGVLCVILLFIHHLHFLLYIPAILLIALLRHRARGTSLPSVALRLGLVAAVISLTFVYLAIIVRPSVPPDVFLEGLRARGHDPVEGGVLKLWFSTIAEEMRDTMDSLPKNLKRVPVYGVLIWLHAPLYAYARQMVRTLSSELDRLCVLVGVVAITLGYFVICAVVFDYARWVSNWAVCMMLVMFAVRPLPSNEPMAVPIAPTRRNAAFAWALTFIPRVGTVMPF
jgi:hypothetical protein